MQKIPTLFQRDPENRKYVLPLITPGCEWVLAGEGIPTRKYDGTCCMFDGERWWARREVKPGKSTPANFRALATDENTGKTVGWEPMEQSAFAKWHVEANLTPIFIYPQGTYELCGPKINRNPEGFERHDLVGHAQAEHLELPDLRQVLAPVALEVLLGWLLQHSYEGIVWHHPDGRMAKLKRRGFATTGDGE